MRPICKKKDISSPVNPLFALRESLRRVARKAGSLPTTRLHGRLALGHQLEAYVDYAAGCMVISTLPAKLAAGQKMAKKHTTAGIRQWSST